MSDPCLLHVLSKEQIVILLNNYGSVKVEWRRIYCRILKYYLKICYTCQKLENGDDAEEEDLLENLENFIDVVTLSMIPIMKESPEMKNAMTLMLCNHPRCINHTSWKQNMDRSFMNWVSHRVSDMGHRRLGISDHECMKLGASTFEEILEKVRNCIQPILVNEMENENFLENLIFAQMCYQIDYKARLLRSEVTPICGESIDNKHVFRKNLARALSIVISDWIVGQENTLNKRRRRNV
jgi:hypothetical protein